MSVVMVNLPLTQAMLLGNRGVDKHPLAAEVTM